MPSSAAGVHANKIPLQYALRTERVSATGRQD